MKMKRIASLLLLNSLIFINAGSTGCSTARKPEMKTPAFIPTAKMQNAMVIAIRDEMLRLDGEGLIPRENRPESFERTTGMLAMDALKNKTVADFYQTFKKLNATYPNLHAGVTFPQSMLNEVGIPGPNIEDWPNIWITTEVLTPTKTKVVVDDIKNHPELKKWEGAEVTAINHQAIKTVLDENFIFCKRALRAQCDRDLENNLLNGELSWKGGPLTYTLKMKGESKDLIVEFKKPAPEEDPYAKKQCNWKWEKRYPGFELIYRGYFACLFQKTGDPSVALLRVSSFQYHRGNKVDPKSAIQDMNDEIGALKKVWIPRSAQTKNLILDLIDNGGGNSPMDYYRLLFHKPFLEQYVEFKKVPEMDDPILRKSLFWESDAHELWFQEQIKNRNWLKLKDGEFSKPTPQFCADETHPCGETLFQPFEHQFNGKISIMINDHCVSSCDGVVWMLHEKLNAQLYGFSHAADYAYSRLRIDVIRDDHTLDGFVLRVSPQRANFPSDVIVSQDVAVSLSTDEKGKVVSGKPLILKKFVPILSSRDYHSDVLKVVLKSIH